MRSIKARFKAIERSNPDLTSYICFTKAVRGQYFKRKMISGAFELLVSKDDYDTESRLGIINHLEKLSNTLEDAQKEPNFAPTAILFRKTMNSWSHDDMSLLKQKIT